VHGTGNDYYGGTWAVNGSTRTIDTYSTDYVGRQGLRFIGTNENHDARPWFMELATLAPHPRPTPAPKYADANVGTQRLNPAINETDRSDKPPYVRSIDVPRSTDRRMRRQQLRTLLSVDDMVQEIFTTLRADRELHNTLVFFLSDNGMLWGEHHLLGKSYPYSLSAGIPMLARWPEHVPAGAVDTRIAANIDIAPTVYEAAGITPDPAYPVDGRSLLEPASRDHLLGEFWRISNDVTPTWAAVRTGSSLYVEYYGKDAATVRFREYYDLTRDPWELVNLLHDGDPGNNPDVAALHTELANDRSCSGPACP
jgi:arylsulfatase A-like enzyme